MHSSMEQIVDLGSDAILTEEASDLCSTFDFLGSVQGRFESLLPVNSVSLMVNC